MGLAPLPLRWAFGGSLEGLPIAIERGREPDEDRPHVLEQPTGMSL
jgi:hypothetical protein